MSSYIIRSYTILLLLGLLLGVFLVIPQKAYAGGIVTNCDDDTDLHSKLADGGVVTFNCPSTPATIPLTTIDISGSHINITQTTIISGNSLITLQGSGSARIFNIAGSTLTLDGLTLNNGRAMASDLTDPVTGDFGNAGGGLRIVNGSVVTITNSSLLNHQAYYQGGAIFVDRSELNIVNSSLQDNQAGYGAAIYIGGVSGTLARATIINSAIISNTAIDGDGGGIRSSYTNLTVANSTLSNNRAFDDTVIPYSGGDGGAIGIYGPASGTTLITNTTIFSNSASQNGGGIQADSSYGSGNIRNSIVANNVAASGANCGGNTITSTGNNIDSGTSCSFSASGDLTNTDPLLGPLANNGGTTLTHALLPGSPAINTADNTACAADSVNNVDQRGMLRPQGAICDIGAVEETSSLAIVKSSVNEGGEPLQPGELITYTISVTNTSSLTATGGIISDTVPANTTFEVGSIKLNPPSAGTEGVSPSTLASNLTIGAGASVSVTYGVKVNTPLANQTQIVNTAWVTSSEVSLPQVSTVTDTVTSAPVLSIHKTSLDVNGGTLVPGETISYTVVVSNSGTANATGGIISDTVPANTTFVVGSIKLNPSSAGTEGVSPLTLASNLTIGAGASVSVTYGVKVNTPLANQTQIVNTAWVTSSEVSLPQVSTVTDTVTSAPVLSIHKTSLDVNGGTLVPGETISYTVAVSNSGTATATGGIISDTVPANTTFEVGSIKLNPSSAGTEGVSPSTLASNLTIGAGASVSVTYGVKVNTPLANQTQIVNTAWVTSSEVSDPQVSTVTDTVTSAPVLSIHKTSLDVNGGTLVPGETISYTVVVSNSGTANATGGIISDTVPANTTFVVGSIKLNPSSAGTEGVSPSTLASNLTIGAGASVSVTYGVKVNTPLANQTQIVNTAWVTSSEVSDPQVSTVTDTVVPSNSNYYRVYLPLIQKN